MPIEIRRTDTLIPYARNPRRHDHAVEQMVASIREFGFKIPMLTLSNGEAVDGHLRLKAALATLAAAQQTGRVCDGMELDPKYVDVAVERWQTLTGQRAVLDGDGRALAEIRRERLAADGAGNGSHG